MSCCITFIPREMAVLMRYSARPGIAQRTSASAETICGCTWRWLLKNRSATITIAAVTTDCATPSTTATRKSALLRARLLTASERAMNVMIALSRPRTPILLMMSVLDQATENMPSAAGPSIRATRNVNIPRKFEANIAIVFKNAPRFSSTPVSSTRSGAATAGGGTSSVASMVLPNWSRSRSEASAISMLDIMSKCALIHFWPETCSKQHTPKLTFALILARRYNRLLGPPKFFAKIDYLRKERGMDLPVGISTLQRADRWIGAPLCFILVCEFYLQ